MPQDQKLPFLKHIYSELETRVGDEIARTMTNEQMLEFKKIINNDTRFAANWLSENEPTYRNDDLFINMIESTGYDEHDPRLLIEYVSAKWLQNNRPDYAQVVATEISKIKSEIKENRDKIL